MSRFNLLAACVFSLLTMFFAVYAFAQSTMDNKRVIVSPAPKSVKCSTVSGHWEGNIWVDTQTVCTYENRTEGVAWVQDYWACTVFTSDGNCTTWEYRPGHWVQTVP